MSNIQKSIPNAKCRAAANGQQAHNRLASRDMRRKVLMKIMEREVKLTTYSP
jgi:hypothetical protein